MSADSVSTNLVIDAGHVFISIGPTEFSVPVPHIGTAVRMLEAARLLTDGAGVNMNVNVARSDSATAPAATTSGPTTGRKRRSRKRVGDALIQWMRQNPGWHTEQALLDAVVEHKMTDAHPKRALKIALGKQRGDVFEGDGQGHWKLIDDSMAGAPPKPQPKKARAAKKKARGGSQRVVGRTGDHGGKLGEAAKAVNRTKRRVRLKTKPRNGEAAAAAESDANSARVVRVKKGQDRKLAALPPSERKARAEGGAGSSAARKKRWQSISTDELERARRNLLGLGSS